MSDISREELAAFTEAHAKSAVALEKLSQAFESIAAKQDKLDDKIVGPLSETIIDNVNSNYNSVHKETMGALERIEKNQSDILKAIVDKLPSTIDSSIKNSPLSTDMNHIKWIVGISAFIIAICTIIVKTLTPVVPDNQGKIIQYLLDQHTQQTEGKTNGSSN